MSIEASFPQADELVRLRAENAALKASLVASEISTPAAWKLTQVEQKIFQMLLKSEVVSKDSIVRILHGAEPKPSAFKNIDVFISRIRQKTKGANVKIETIFAVGYRLLDREAWLKALQARLVEQN